MTTRLDRLLSPALLLAALPMVVLPAQDDMAAEPAPELRRLAPMVGNWVGKGTMSEPGGVETAWRAHGSYRWALGGHFVEEDFLIEFEGSPAPFVFRSYVGWDRERERYVAAIANSAGQVQLAELQILPDGTFLQLMLQNQGGMPYAERSRVRIDGDAMTMQIDFLMPEGDSMRVIDGAFERRGDEFRGEFGAKGWMGATPNDAMQRLARMCGTYDLTGQMAMMPGAPMTEITGTDSFRSVWGGNVVHGRTEGHAAGAPEAYESHAFWAWDGKRDCIRCVSPTTWAWSARWTCTGPRTAPWSAPAPAR